MLYSMQQRLCHYDKSTTLGTALIMYSCSKTHEKYKSLVNHGEIPHSDAMKICVVYRDKLVINREECHVGVKTFYRFVVSEHL